MEFFKLLIIIPFLSVFAYAAGSVPWGLVLTKIFTSQKITREGSGNIGATNVTRVAGKGLGLLTLIGDMLKGAVPVYLAVTVIGKEGAGAEVCISLIALSAFMGHLYPVFMKFKHGGKGVATAAGCFLIISPLSVLIAVLIFIMMICWFSRVSVGSLAAAAVLPVAVWKILQSEVITGCAVIIAVFIYFRHKDNIKRLFSGTEPKIVNSE
jgi:glycerol-3-phosphate acyltransferase PlsY